MNTIMTLADKIESVKTSTATNRFHKLAAVYGSARNATDALDCRNGTMQERIAEAIATIKIGISCRIFKMNGEVVVEAK